jgi:hypothetical protein
MTQTTIPLNQRIPDHFPAQSNYLEQYILQIEENWEPDVIRGFQDFKTNKN